MNLCKAHALAQFIMWSQARVLKEASNANFRQEVSYYYDQLAATCLGDLIYKTMTGRKP